MVVETERLVWNLSLLWRIKRLLPFNPRCTKELYTDGDVQE